jgi:hypothetical protein
MRNARAWKINPATCATKTCYQFIKTTWLESAVFLNVEKCFGRWCQGSGEDLCTEFHVLNVRTYLQLKCGSVLFMLYVIR